MEKDEVIYAFRNSILNDTPDKNWSSLIQALWLDGKGDWEGAHELIQDDTSSGAAWIHAYLHRKEGDDWNADYWYRRAGKTRPGVSLEEEWESLVKHFME